MRRCLFMVAVMAASVMSLCGCSDDEDNVYEKNYKEGMEYMLENAKREGVVTTSTGLQYEVLQEGREDGVSPDAMGTVRCHYEGRFIDGTLFESSYSGEPVKFSLTTVINGWREGLTYMKEGAKYRFFIPYYLGYGVNGYGSIPPYATLIFDVELIEVVN